ncbi:MAG: hypothetical protein R3A10_22830 [Caldilineaceae bacterium]
MRVTFECALMAGINDTPEQAHELGGKLADILCHVNVIPLNPIPDSPYQPASGADTAASWTSCTNTACRLRY